jgi:hypothetical protein
LTRWTNLSPDGFTLYYQHAAGLSGLLWVVAGLGVLGRTLRRHFSDGVTAATLVTILLGTNLYHYATFDSSYSHPYSFFLFAAFLELTERWYERPRKGVSVLLGIVAGLIILTRHTNALFLIFFPLYAVTNLPTLRARLTLLSRERWLVAAMIAAAAVIVSPQLAIYHQATGRLLVSSYGELGFNFASPRIVQVLFSVQKGLFFWSPVLLTSGVGFIWLARSQNSARTFVAPAILFLLADTCVIASWWDWQFGASFGHRGFVDTLPVFAIGVAGCFSAVAGHQRFRRPVAVVVVLVIALNLFQMLQYWNHVLPFSDTTWDQYRQLFLRWR